MLYEVITNEAERCDRISLMHAGRVLISDSPEVIKKQKGAETLEQAFIRFLEEAGAQDGQAVPKIAEQVDPPSAGDPAIVHSCAPHLSARSWFSFRRALSYSRRETMELRRDPIRATLALLGSVISYNFV